jgi:hypothetical protein
MGHVGTGVLDPACILDWVKPLPTADGLDNNMLKLLDMHEDYSSPCQG